MRKLIITLTVAGLAVAFGAAPGVAGSGSVKQYCKAQVAVDSAGEDGPSERQLQRLIDTAPPEIADTTEAAVSLFEEQGEAAFDNPEFTALLAEMDEFVLDNCGYEQVDATLLDYAFDGVPDELEKGVVAFNLTNEGAELHELVIVRLKGDATLDDILELPEDASDEDFDELASEVPGGGFAFPGESDLALVNLKKTGNYAALCFIPVGTTPDTIEGGGEGGTGPPHFMEGMAAEFEVTS